jgi:serine protease AprX
VTPDGPVAATDLISDSLLPLSSTQLWPYESGNAQLWSSVDAASGVPAIAVVDSGVDATAPDVAGRVVASVDLSSATPNSPGDGRGHGTFVAGIAAGSAAGHAGAAPGAKLVSVDVLDDDGMGWTSDVIAGAEWILAHKDEYGIRIANFSLNGSAESTFMYDPLDKAVERLWLSGVVVVTAAGNYGEGAEGTVKYSPANDPFVITVGAADLAGTADPSDDFAAPWSAYGFTYDGFRKPEVGASGRYMIGPAPTGSTLVSERPGNVVSPGYMQLSGTSFAAPVVSGSAAHVLALHPGYTPDQVKGALMVTARPTAAASWSLGLGETDAVLAATVADPPNPNEALEAYVAGGVFDADVWQQAAQDNANWNQANWNQANWNSANPNAANWNQANWNQANWNQAAAEDAAREQAAVGEAIPGGYALTAEQAAALATDPLLSPLP